MRYKKVTFNIMPYSEDAADLLSALCGEIGFESFTDEEEVLTGYIQQDFLDEEALQGVFTDFPMPDTRITCEITDAENKNWNETWEKNGFEPIQIGSDLLVRAVWHETIPGIRYDICLDPKMAFGTGSHVTTRMILTHLLQMDLQNKDVLDAGCGTGVLGILTALKGAAHVMAYDIDEWSVRNTEVNAALNGISCMTVREGDASILPGTGPFDVVLANINRNILLADIPQFARVLKEGGTLVISGFYETDIAVLLEKAATYRLQETTRYVDQGWSCLILKKNA